MATRPTNKVVLSFNSGEYSPFMDSRSDIEKAAQAARKLRNMQALTGGEARRRPGLRYVATVDPAVVNILTNYVEFPYWYFFLYQNADGVNGQYHAGIEFRGKVRLWESGTVELEGYVRFQKVGPTAVSATTYAWRMWVGTVDSDGTLLTGSNSLVMNVSTVGPYDGSGYNAWQSVSWSVKPSPGSYVSQPYISQGLTESDPPSAAVRVWQYPDGLVMPHFTHVSGTAGSALAFINTTASRSGNDLVLSGDWSASEGGFGQPGIGLWRWIADVSDADPRNWTRSDFEILENFQSSFGSGTTTDTFSHSVAITDSETIGEMYRSLVGASNVTSVVSTFNIGPILRTDYAPVIQQGIDPL